MLVGRHRTGHGPAAGWHKHHNLLRPTIMASTGLTSSSSILATLVVGLVNAVFTIVSLVIIERVGRRPLLLTRLVGITIALGVLGVGYLASLSGATTWTTFAGLILYIASFALSYGVVLWVVLPEIFPLRIRGSAMSVCTILHWSSSLAISLSLLPLIQASLFLVACLGDCFPLRSTSISSRLRPLVSGIK